MKNAHSGSFLEPNERKKEPPDSLTPLCHAGLTLSCQDRGQKPSGTWEVNASNGSGAQILLIHYEVVRGAGLKPAGTTQAGRTHPRRSSNISNRSHHGSPGTAPEPCARKTGRAGPIGRSWNEPALALAAPPALWHSGQDRHLSYLPWPFIHHLVNILTPDRQVGRSSGHRNHANNPALAIPALLGGWRGLAWILPYAQPWRRTGRILRGHIHG